MRDARNWSGSASVWVINSGSGIDKQTSANGSHQRRSCLKPNS